MSDDERIEVGDMVETDSGNVYPVVGREQGGRTLQLPTGPGGATREFWRDDLEVVKKDATLFNAYTAGLNNAPTDREVAEALAALALEDLIPPSSLPRLHRVIDPDTAAMVGDRMDGDR